MDRLFFCAICAMSFIYVCVCVCGCICVGVSGACVLCGPCCVIRHVWMSHGTLTNQLWVNCHVKALTIHFVLSVLFCCCFRVVESKQLELESELERPSRYMSHRKLSCAMRMFKGGPPLVITSEFFWISNVFLLDTNEFIARVPRKWRWRGGTRVIPCLCEVDTAAQPQASNM